MGILIFKRRLIKMNITTSTYTKRSKNRSVGKVAAIGGNTINYSEGNIFSGHSLSMAELNARRDAKLHNDSSMRRDFEGYNDAYTKTYGSRNAYSAGWKHNCCNQCNGVSIFVLVVTAVAGFALSFVMADGIRHEVQEHKREKLLTINGEDNDPIYDDIDWYDPEKKEITHPNQDKTKLPDDFDGATIYKKYEELGSFWNWVVGAAGAILSLIVAGFCMHTCAESKNKIEARHNVVGAQLAGLLAHQQKGHGASVNHDEQFDLFPPKQMPNATHSHPMSIPQEQPMFGGPMQTQPMMMGGPPMMMRGQRSMSMPSQPNFPDTSQQPLYVGPIDENTKKFERGLITVHKPKIQKEIVGYDLTEIPIPNQNIRRSNRRRSRRDVDEELSDY